jgi:hypothetical protein
MKFQTFAISMAVASALNAVAVRAAATSANYAIAASVIDAGGGRSASANYAQTLSIATLGGLNSGSVNGNAFGFTAQLNNAPMAFDDTRSHPQDSAIQIPIAALLGNDIDDDGDAITLTQTDPLSEAGAAVTVAGDSVFYAGRIGFTGVDHFNYVIADDSGETDTGTVSIYVAPPIGDQPANTVVAIKQADGGYLLRFKGPAGFDEYVIQYNDNLNTNLWQNLVVQPARADGLMEVYVGKPTLQQRYFRAFVRDGE